MPIEVIDRAIDAACKSHIDGEGAADPYATDTEGTRIPDTGYSPFVIRDRQPATGMGTHRV